MQSKAPTVAAYLKELPPDRRKVIEAVRKVIRASVDTDSVQEMMGYGMMGFAIPHRVFPQGYHCDPSLPVPYIGLASQKQYISLYLMHVYGGEEERFIRDGFAKAGLKANLGKCCLRFRKLEDIDLDVVAESIRRVPALEYLRRYVAAVPKNAWKKAKPKAPATKRAVAKTTGVRKATVPKRAAAKK
jgi:Domain of unknown function (DU1801)